MTDVREKIQQHLVQQLDLNAIWWKHSEELRNTINEYIDKYEAEGFNEDTLYKAMMPHIAKEMDYLKINMKGKLHEAEQKLPELCKQELHTLRGQLNAHKEISVDVCTSLLYRSIELFFEKVPDDMTEEQKPSLLHAIVDAQTSYHLMEKRAFDRLRNEQ